MLEDNATIANTISTNVESNIKDNNIPLKTESERQVTTIGLVKFRGDQACQQTWPLQTMI